LSKGFLAGKEEASDIQISGAAFYRKHGIAIYRSAPVGEADLRNHRLDRSSGELIGFEKLLIATGSTVNFPLKDVRMPSLYILYIEASEGIVLVTTTTLSPVSDVPIESARVVHVETHVPGMSSASVRFCTLSSFRREM
jgi:hypothetical protein